MCIKAKLNQKCQNLICKSTYNPPFPFSTEGKYFGLVASLISYHSPLAAFAYNRNRNQVKKEIAIAIEKVRNKEFYWESRFFFLFLKHGRRKKVFFPLNGRHGLHHPPPKKNCCGFPNTIINI